GFVDSDLRTLVRGQLRLYPLFVVALDSAQPFRRVFARLIIDPLVVTLAEQDQVVVGVEIDLTEQVATRPGGRLRHNVTLTAHQRLSVTRCGLHNQVASTNGTSVPRPSP